MASFVSSIAKRDSHTNTKAMATSPSDTNSTAPGVDRESNASQVETPVNPMSKT
jgi:hypothetical protein